MELEEYYDKAREINLHLLIIYPRGDKRKIKVIDNQFDWEANDFRLVTKNLYSYIELERVLKIAKELANKTNKEYISFESRYCKFKEEDYGYDNINEELIEEIESYIK
jgi:hypothetical protein